MESQSRSVLPTIFNLEEDVEEEREFDQVVGIAGLTEGLEDKIEEGRGIKDFDFEDCFSKTVDEGGGIKDLGGCFRETVEDEIIDLEEDFKEEGTGISDFKEADFNERVEDGIGIFVLLEGIHLALDAATLVVREVHVTRSE